MRLPGGWTLGRMKGPRTTRVTYAEGFGRNRIYLVGETGVPVWVWALGPLWRHVPIQWQRLADGHGRWWVGQMGQRLVVAGYGIRPALSLKAEDWTGVLPSGRQSIVVQLPKNAPCQVMTMPGIVPLVSSH